jgi:hypothetical protein
MHPRSGMPGQVDLHLCTMGQFVHVCSSACMDALDACVPAHPATCPCFPPSCRVQWQTSPQNKQRRVMPVAELPADAVQVSSALCSAVQCGSLHGWLI